MRKMLTDAFVRTIEPPTAGRMEVSDLRCAGLTLRITPNKAKTWSLRFRDPKSRKLTRATIGAYPEVTLEQARDKGHSLRREIAAGVNPVDRKRKDRDEAPGRTFQALADRYMTEHARRHKRTAEADDRALKLHILPEWRARAFAEIGRADVITLCEGIVSAGKPTQANRVQALISKIFSFAVDSDLLSANPCARLKKRSKEVKATRVLTDGEIRLFWGRVAERPNSQRIGQALQLLLLTGARVTELAGAKIEEFDRLAEPEAASWTVPPERSKNGKPHVVPLSRAAIQIVGDLMAEAKKRAGAKVAQFLMVSPADPKKPIDGHSLSVAMTRFGNGLIADGVDREFTEEEGRAIESWRVGRPTAHDLRRTLATRLAKSGIPAEDVSACLNHARRGVTALHYDHYDRLREKRRAFALWAQQIADLVGGHWAPNVVPLGKPAIKAS
jgi:integrase